MTKRRTLPATNAELQAAVDRFSAAAQGQTADLHDATGDLLSAFAATAQRQVMQAYALLVDKFDEVDRKLELHQHHLHQVDLVLDEQARERAVGESHES